MLPFPSGSLIVAYLRDSGGDDQDLSVEQQETVARTWCAQNSLVLTQVFKDLAVSGSSTVGRHAFQAMMQYFRQKTTPPEVGIIIWKYSRFARDIDDAQFHKADLRRRGYIIHSLNDAIPEGLNGRFFEAALDWMNAKFLEDLSTDVKRGLHHLVTQYGAMAGVPPRGFKREPVTIGSRRDGTAHVVHRWVPDPDWWETCRLAWQMRAQGATYDQVHQATHLYRSLNSYRDFFSNRLYLGELRCGEVVIPDYAPALVDRSTWEAVQALNHRSAQRRLSGAENRDHPRRVQSTFFLSGLLYCGQCGAPMNGDTVRFSRGKVYEYYACSRQQRSEECQARKIPREAVENAVLETLEQYVLTPETLAAIQSELQSDFTDHAGELQARRGELATQLGALRHRLSNLTQAIAEAGHSRAILTALQELETQEAALAAQISQLDQQLTTCPPRYSEERIREIAANLWKILTDAPPAERNPILRSFVHRITVERDGKTLRGLIEYYRPPMEDEPDSSAPGLQLAGPGAKSSSHPNFMPIPRTSVGAPDKELPKGGSFALSPLNPIEGQVPKPGFEPPWGHKEF